MKGIDHIERPRLPWRNGGTTTECGLPAANHPVITRDVFLARVKELGQQRAAMVTCMTCFQTARHWPTWEEDPGHMLGRETSLNSYRSTPLDNELRAIALLVANHREEFDGLLDELAGVNAPEATRAAGVVTPDPRLEALTVWARGMAASYFYEDAYCRARIRGSEAQQAFARGMQAMIDERRAARALNGIRVA